MRARDRTLGLEPFGDRTLGIELAARARGLSGDAARPGRAAVSSLWERIQLIQLLEQRTRPKPAEGQPPSPTGTQTGQITGQPQLEAWPGHLPPGLVSVVSIYQYASLSVIKPGAGL